MGSAIAATAATFAAPTPHQSRFRERECVDDGDFRAWLNGCSRLSEDRRDNWLLIRDAHNFAHPYVVDARYAQPMAEEDPRAKYRVLPSAVDPDDLVADVDATTTDSALAELRDPNVGAEPYLRAVGWSPPR